MFTLGVGFKLSSAVKCGDYIAELKMNGNIDAIYKYVCDLVHWIVCPVCKYFGALLVVKGGIEMISTLSRLSWRPLQKVLGLHVQEVRE